jgi:hypothetical protein
MTGSVFSGNSARQQGGAIFAMKQSKLKSSSCQLERNSAVIGGGAVVVSDSKFDFLNSQVGASWHGTIASLITFSLPRLSFLFKFAWNFVSRRMGGAVQLELGASGLFTGCRWLLLKGLHGVV